MKALAEFLGACVFGLFAAGLFWLALELDNAELQAGKSPHSGFSPSCPTAFDGFVKPSRPSRYGGY